MLKSAQRMIAQAADSLGLDNTAVNNLLRPDHIHAVEINAGDKIFKGYRVQHSNKRGPYKGGIRFHPEVDVDEVQAMATLMSMKTAAVNIPLGGGKGGIVIDVKEYDMSTLEKVARGYVRELHSFIGPEKDVPAPDVGTTAQVIDWMVDEYEKITGDTTKASFTGKSIENGGSKGREEATGRGGVIVLKEILKNKNIDPKEISVGVQGAGNVGFFFAKIAQQEYGMNITAISNSRRTLFSAEGFDFTQIEYSRDVLKDMEDLADHDSTPDAVMVEEADVLVCAALSDAVTQQNYKNIKARIILELANGPVEHDAHEALHKAGTIIIPDIIANSGGVIVSYYEWLQNRSNEIWEIEKVNNMLDQTLTKATQETMGYAEKNGVSLKQAAFEIAIQRLLA